jgi:hypothetical protein
VHRELIRILKSERPAPCDGERRDRLWAAALKEMVAVPVALKTGVPAPESWLIEQQLLHETRLLWLRRILARLEAASVRAVALKGPVFAERYYDPPYGRPSLDLDLALAPAQLDRAVRELERLGYAAERILFVALDQHVVLTHEIAPPVELHYRLLSEFGANQDIAGFLARARTVEIPRLGAVLAPDPVDEFVFLCAHAAKHRFRALRWGYDLYLFLRRAELDPDLVWRRAAGFRVRRLLALTAAAIEKDWEIVLPGIPEAARAQAARILPRFTRVRPPVHSKAGLLARHVAGMVACDNLGSRLRWWWRIGASFSQRVAMETFGRSGRLR